MEFHSLAYNLKANNGGKQVQSMLLEVGILFAIFEPTYCAINDDRYGLKKKQQLKNTAK